MYELTQNDLLEIVDALATGDNPERALFAVHEAARKRLGIDATTVSRLERASLTLTRVFSSIPRAYPVGGSKEKAGTAWAEHVLRLNKPHFARSRDEVRMAFDDHDKLFSLGINCVLNFPVVFNGYCVGTLNFLSTDYVHDHNLPVIGHILASLIVPVLALPSGSDPLIPARMFK